MSLRVSKATLAYLAVAFFTTAPAWIVKYPPIQDLPFHLATIRVFHDYSNPLYGFSEDFILTIGRTQYVLYYLVGSLLAYLVGVVNANIALLCAILGGTVLGLRALLAALGKDERLCLFAVPLAVNVMFCFGLLPFLLGIPIMLWALARTIRYFEQPTIKSGLLLAALAVALFYSHIFTFGVFGLGFAALFPWTSPSRWWKSALPPVPALCMLAYWTLFTDAGKLTRGALLDSGHAAVPSIGHRLPATFGWLTDIFADGSDEILLVASIMAAILCVGLAHGDRERAKPHVRAFVLLPLACIVLYFGTSDGHGYIWLISQRFPLMFFLTAIPLLRMPARSWRRVVATLAIGGVGIATIVNVCRHFIEFQVSEVGDFDEAIEAMEPRKHVATLIFDRGSRVMNWAPFLHFGSYYQLQKGGVVQFTYAGYAHWPFDFKPDHYPPPGDGPARPRWEWTPEQVKEDELVPYYDYVLVRGRGFTPSSKSFHMKFRGQSWTVWERGAAAVAAPAAAPAAAPVTEP